MAHAARTAVVRDQILIKGDTSQEAVTIDRWLARPVVERIGFITAGSVQFFAGDTRISTRDALAAIRASRPGA